MPVALSALLNCDPSSPPALGSILLGKEEKPPVRASAASSCIVRMHPNVRHHLTHAREIRQSFLQQLKSPAENLVARVLGKASDVPARSWHTSNGIACRFSRDYR